MDNEPESRASSAPTRVLIVDDHAAFAEPLAAVLGLQQDMECAGIAGRCDEAIKMAEELRPDVVLMDVQLPDDDGIDAAHRVKEVSPDSRVLILTAYSEVDVMARAAAAGAAGFIPKETALADILHAIRTARDGGMLVEGNSLTALLAHIRSVDEPRPATTTIELTPREFDVLALMGEGRDAQTIARSLGITVLTCRGHIKKIHSKLGVHSQLEAVVTAMRLGLLPSP
ncbi:MAG TPA: response regulator transcription factor [Actinomycetota bacterium]